MLEILKNGLESTVVKVENDNIIILRPGSVTVEQLEKVANVIIDKNVLKKVKSNEKVQSPGMKYRHYAPKTKCLLVYFKDENKQIEEIQTEIQNQKNKNKKVAVIGFLEHKSFFKNAQYFIDFGNVNCYNEVAHNIYSVIRKADNLNVDFIIIEGVPKEEIGLAIMNRLYRAVSGNILEK